MSLSDQPILDVLSSGGGFAVRETVRFAFFVRRPHIEAAPAVVRAFEHLIDVFPPPALSTFSIDSGDWLEYDAEGLKDQVRERLLDNSINGSAHVAGDQANIPDYDVEYAGLAIDRPTFREASLALWFSIGATVFEPRREAALEVRRHIIEMLDCSAAYVDIALEGDRPRLQAMARRYRNIDISRVRIVARDLADKLPGAFWRTYIGKKLVATLGGPTEIARALGGDAQVEPFDRGLEITLGTGPTLGDVNRNAVHGPREALAQLAHSHGQLHVPRKVKYFEGSDNLSPLEAQERWHLRFVQSTVL